MNNSIFTRVLTTVYAVIITVFSVITVVVTLNRSLYDRLVDYIREDIFENRYLFFFIIIVSLILLALSIAYLSSGLRGDKDKKVVKKHTNVGILNISLVAIENIALAAAKKINGVREAKAQILKIQGDESIAVVLKVVVLADINIPAVSQELQLKVKKSIEESSGVTVDNVKVVVENIMANYRSRVE